MVEIGPANQSQKVATYIIYQYQFAQFKLVIESFPATECNQQEFGYFTGSQAHSRLLHRDALAPNDPQGIP